VTKDELRASLREKRKSFVQEHGRQVPFPDQLLELVRSGGCIAGYSATKWEADIAGWWPHLRQNDHRLALPYLKDRASVMDFREWDSNSPLEPADYGFTQPNQDAAVVQPEIILVPLIGFDRSGNRLGQGQGHYDRYFSLFLNSMKIGIAFSCQELATIPIDTWDIPLDAIVTEQEWIFCPSYTEREL
jgi:5-formyltetrahydrofolate cyclo-ligase